MFTHFTKEEKAVHYPADRRVFIAIKPCMLIIFGLFISLPKGAGFYYDTNSLDNCLKPQSILAWEINYEPLPLVHGAPLRLRVENQLGYKMVKWISF